MTGLDPDVSQIIVKAEGVAPLVRRSAKGSADVRVASLSVLRDVAKHGHPLMEAGKLRLQRQRIAESKISYYWSQNLMHLAKEGCERSEMNVDLFVQRTVVGRAGRSRCSSLL